MEPSPLTQQSRPEVFQQKIVELYDALFKVTTFRAGLRTVDANDCMLTLHRRMKKAATNLRDFGRSSSSSNQTLRR
jgi:hypothetical protein